MTETYRACWAKKTPEPTFQWLPLHVHLHDAAFVINQLWDHYLSAGQKALLNQSLTTPGRGRELAIFLAAVHDIGKATPAFQLKEGYIRNPDLDQLLWDKLARLHIDLDSLTLADMSKSPHALAGEKILADMGLDPTITCIIGAHHGKPIETSQLKEQEAYLSNYYFSDQAEGKNYEDWHRMHQEICAEALSLAGFFSLEDVPQVPKKAAEIVLSGLLIMADWLASNEDYFPLLPIASDMDDEALAERGEAGWLRWYRTGLWKPYQSPAQPFEARFPFAPNATQEGLIKAITEAEEPGIFILEAPMGGGKTEAALYGAECLAQKAGQSGLFFGLPTQATSDGIFNRIKDFTESLAKDSEEALSIHLVHGKAALNEDFRSMAHQVDIDGDEGRRGGTITVNEWFSGKKQTALDDFVVGTVDHCLLLALKKKHVALRHLGFSKKVVIIDEVHAYDSYMGQYLARALEWLSAMGVPVIILSATLPMDTRKNLIQAYLRGREVKMKKEALSSQLDYPLVTYTDGNEVKMYTDFPKVKKQRRYAIINLQEEEVIQVAQEAIEKQAVLGIIVDTVKKAQQVYQTLSGRFGGERTRLLHSNFIATERVAKEQELLSLIGKGAQRPKGMIIIGTQVIEQSLDIDFDQLITELAPMDLVIQRLGRLHRHEIVRPPGYETPRAYILGRSEAFLYEEEGMAYVYSKLLLARTDRLLPPEIELPGDISRLVQATYDVEDPLDLSEADAATYASFNKERDERIAKKKRKAKDYRLPAPKASGRDGMTLRDLLDNANPNEEEQAFAQVRDIEETIEVIALKAVADGYGLFSQGENIQPQLSEPSIARQVAQQTLRLPRLLSWPEQIKKTLDFLEDYNLKNLPEFQASSWLKGRLGIIFDQDNEFKIGSYCLKYDTKVGLFCEKDKDVVV